MLCTHCSQDEVPKPAGSSQVRNLVVKDTTGEIHVALWNKKALQEALQEVKSGDTVRMTHMSARHVQQLFKDDCVVFNTTDFTPGTVSNHILIPSY